MTKFEHEFVTVTFLDITIEALEDALCITGY